MSSRRRSRSRDRSKTSSSNSKLRMDSKPQSMRITDPSLPAGRRREIDNVMKKARASPNSNTYWDKKLLEVEAKDPNRWRHSGYKSMYLDGSSSPSSGRRSRSRSPTGRRSPPGRRSPAGRRSPRSPPTSSRRSPLARRPSPRSPPTSSRPHPRMPRSPPHMHKSAQRRSPSASSVSSCSDDSCSVCSPKNRGARSRSRSFSVSRTRGKGHSSKGHGGGGHGGGGKKVGRARPPSPTPSPPTRRIPRPMTPPPTRRGGGGSNRPSASTSSDKPTDPRRQPPPVRPRNRCGEIIDVTGVKPPPPKAAKKSDKDKDQPVLLTRIKKERTKKRNGSPGGDSSGSEDSSTSSTSAIVATTRLTLSERFGKMAQWSVDRERRDIENMRITKTGSDLKVMIEEDDFLYGSPPRRYSISPVPAGHFPDELLASSSSRMAGWDDVRVRYQYYKDLGYLRDLTLDDYVKWEEWWYKYQDWLANERHYEHWLSTQNRRRRKRLPATQRLN
ncbi:PREDICTED: serine/arginine repetitive matrix protein 1 isoform X2 [Nicrophorus vespilloides]|uniref:Serine/arginine repetitive matrix protein 1 isoform X2 n=1 Tax=Nicrophorus vespilloides TaxID=110193 RepID=A0ABM1M0N7_NICVS|nr:PREDICTED: serine/arginine repetitive matrix protein 1 isoform X2 [Nicrophorus vespilloides]